MLGIHGQLASDDRESLDAPLISRVNRADYHAVFSTMHFKLRLLIHLLQAPRYRHLQLPHLCRSGTTRRTMAPSGLSR